MRSISRLAGPLVLLLVVSACGGGPGSNPVESPVTEAEVTRMAEDALQGFNAGDYGLWAGDWSDDMRRSIDEQAFLAFRDQTHPQTGDFVAIESVTGAPGQDPGTYRWTFELQFENGTYRMWLGFKEGSPLIEGINFESAAS